MPRKRPSRPAIAPADLYDHLNFSPTRLLKGPRTLVLPSVSDDWPDVVPISEHELRITEAYLETVLAELLGPLP